MKITALALLASSLFIASCSTDYGSPKVGSPQICQGFGCPSALGSKPNSAETHKPTKDEKIRVRSGEKPNFGSENISVGFPVRW